jgi:amino acid adenylation domain-containing protein
MDEVTERLAALSPKERAALAMRLARKSRAGDSGIARRRDSGPAPLSYAQRRLWFLAQVEAARPTYNFPIAYELHGALDVGTLARAFNEVVRRHESLRTTFTVRDGEPVQIVHPSLTIELPFVELPRLEDPDALLAELRRLADGYAQRPFDLERGPLVRATLLKVSDERHHLVVVVHHIVADASSMGVLLTELSALYHAFNANRPSPLKEPTVQYADFAVWQREWLEGEVMQRQLRYWKEKLADPPPPLRLPTDRPRPAAETSRGGSQFTELPEELTRGLKELCRQEGATLFMALLAAFDVLLYKYTGQTDLSVGTPVSGRSRSEAEGLIGLFLNTLVLRTDLSGRPTFRELLGRAREVMLEALAHQDVPFEKLVGELQPGRAAGHSPLFQVMLTLQNAPMEVHAPSDELTMFFGDLDVDIGATKFDLTLSVEELDECLLAFWGYKTDLFDGSTVARMAAHFQTLLERLVADPDRRISELDLLGEDERRRLLGETNATAAPYSADVCAHQLFEAQAAANPDATALVFGEARVSYAELNERADRLARRLRRLGVRPEETVGLYFERSLEMVVALLAVLKAGGAYVPLDPSYPEERLKFMLEDSCARLLLAARSHDGLTPQTRARVVFVDDDEEQAEASDEGESRAPAATPRNAAYVIYTSGSTGRPKGVVVEHRGVCNLAEAQARAFDIGPGARVLQFAPFSFDASVSEIFTALTTGATLVLAPRASLLPGPALVEMLREQGVTTVTFPPTVLAATPDAELPDLRTLVVAGEECPAEVARRWAEGRRFLNAYGPTETTVCATIAERPDTRNRLPIGLPMSNTEVYLLDEDLRPVPVGVTGELHVGGVGLARGYLNRPGLTAERFIPHAFGREPGARLYKTGDLARFRPDGLIELLGRRDQQLKVRGFRVEPGEIEAALAAHPDVRQAAVVALGALGALGEAPGERRLVAYVSPAGGATPEPDALRRHLKGRLPEHMIPSAFVALDSLPLTPSGKVDRAALPSPDGARPRLEQAFVAPRGELEAMLCEMWRGVLRVEEVGVFDNFFDLGGDSIHAAVFINSLQKRLGAVVYVVALFDAPNVASLAAYLAEHYPEAVARVCGDEPGDRPGRAATRRIDAARVSEIRELIAGHARPEPDGAASSVREKNPPAVFVLSPPRSGSTLLRVMLAGHPALFAPPELELLSFRTLAERREALSGRYGFWLEGTVRALMQLDGADAERAAAVMRECEARGMTTREFYRFLQERAAGRRLVDKTPSYALEEGVLRRAENYFDGALYVHLLRHPLGMIRSFEDAKLEQVFFRYRHDYARRELAELIWDVSQQNILKFLADVPPARRYALKFEELVENPRAALEGLCAFLGVEFHAEMLQPYRDKGSRMTDGIHPLSKMLGDVKFHAHDRIDAKVAERWKDAPGDAAPLGDVTRDLAASFGYETPDAPPATAAARELTPMRAAARGGTRRFPLSFAQQRLWFIDRLTLDSPFYNIPEALRLGGRLDVGALERSFDEIVRRHEALRTAFTTDGANPVQVVCEPARACVGVTDLSALPEDAREREALRLAVEEAQRPFDLTRAPLTRARLLRLGAREHVLLVTTHHIVSDGWSVGVFLRELSALYGAHLRGEPSPLEELPAQYADFAVWQREWLQGEVLEEQLRYWRRQLGGELPVLELPTDRPRPPALSYKGADRHFELTAELTGRLKEFSRREGVTLFMSLLAAFNALLHRYTGQTDLVVGAPIAGRNRRELEGLIGFFVNTLALRTDLSGRPSFRELLGRVRATTLGAFAHQELPFEKLVEELHPQRDMSRNPLFQVTLALQNAPLEEMEMPGLRVSPLDIGNDATRFDLEFHLWEAEGQLAGNLIYNTDLFDAATVERMLGHFANLLEAALDAPDVRLSDLPMMTEAQRRQVLEAWNDTRGEYPRDACVHELFEAQAARAPEAAAVTAGDARLTYGELNASANRLARRLRALGVGAESRVGVLMERSPEMVAAFLAILKAGGAYVPLDLSYPKPRLRFMLEDAGVRVVLTGRRQLSLLPDSGAHVLCLDGEGEEIARERAEDLGPVAAADNAACVIYTSGSTGRAKGVCIDHRAVNRLVCRTDYIELSPSDRVAQTSTATFDAATFEIWGALLNGAQLDIVPRDTALSPAALAAHIKERGVTVLFLTTALFNQVAAAQPRAFAPLDNLMFGGEAADPRWVREVLSKGGQRRLLHFYGPTENTTFSTWHLVEAVEENAATVPIGGPVKNTQAYILDGDLRPVPVGVAGELCVGGDGLMRGYLNRPALTAEKLVPHPFSTEPGARLYRTGDLTRFRPDGRIEFLGRVDHQVKIRGHRIEPGEIEAVTSEHPSVRECVVLAREDRPGERRLVAYVVAAPDSEAVADAEAAGDGLRTGQVEHWQRIFDDHIYNRPAAQPDPTFNIIGWNSTYTDEPVPAEEMRVWLEDTLAPLRAARPRRVLEIGCGTGLLLAQLAPGCERYCGTDVSQVALDYVRRQILARADVEADVTLLRRAADDFEGVEPGSFDAVILNSVVQYFPDVDYLLRVMEGAARAVAPGGIIFVGDVRSLPLLEAFHASIQLFKAPAALPVAQLREQVRTRAAQENELAVDPAFFFALRRRLPQVGRVEVRPKRGRYHNELTRFRYQVLIHVGVRDDGRAADSPRQLDWEAEGLTLDALRRRLAAESPAALALERVPNARLSAELRTLELLADEEGARTAGELRAIKDRAASGVDPEDLHALGGELGYAVDISWARHGADGRFDVLLRAATQGEGEDEDKDAAFDFPEPAERGRAWKEFGNNPLRRALARELVPLLRAHLQERLPEYMVPADFVMLDSLPLNSSGKVDRRRLPAPDVLRPELKESFVAPRTEVEERVAAVWSEVLGLERIGVHDNFFDLGGHSLVATQVVTRLCDAFEMELPLRCLFESPTVAGVAAAVVQRRAAQADAEGLAQALRDLEQLSDEEARAMLTRGGDE